MTSTHLAMDYREIDTAAEILAAFKGCANAGEEIQLFESLAEREHPPVGEFVTILKEIKLETALALAIQAFGKIKDDEIKAGLKGSSDLLVLLCEQAKSGSTDLIRWSAATTIEKIGFDFIAVSRHLTEEPEVIIQRIVQSKVKVLTDAERNRHGIKENNDYDSLIRFWVYGATYELRAATVNSGGGNAAIVVNAVVKAQDVWGIKQTSFLFLALENHARISLNQTEQRIYENQLFERECQLLASQLLLQHQNSTKIEILVSNQIHCLQSNIESVRKYAALILLSLDNRILDVLKQHNSALSSMIAIFSKDSFGERDDFYYQEVIQIVGCLEIAKQYSSRKITVDHYNELHENLSYFINNRKENINKETKEIIRSEQTIIDTLNEIELIFPQIHSKYCNIHLETMPEVNIENDRWQIILSEYHKKIKIIIRKLNDSIGYEENRIGQEEIRRQEEKRRQDNERQAERRRQDNERQEEVRNIQKLNDVKILIRDICTQIGHTNSASERKISSTVLNSTQTQHNNQPYDELKILIENVTKECNNIIKNIESERLGIKQSLAVAIPLLEFCMNASGVAFGLSFSIYIISFGYWANFANTLFIGSILTGIISCALLFLSKESSNNSQHHREAEKALLIQLKNLMDKN